MQYLCMRNCAIVKLVFIGSKDNIQLYEAPASQSLQYRQYKYVCRQTHQTRPIKRTLMPPPPARVSSCQPHSRFYRVRQHDFLISKINKTRYIYHIPFTFFITFRTSLNFFSGAFERKSPQGFSNDYPVFLYCI